MSYLGILAATAAMLIPGVSLAQVQTVTGMLPHSAYVHEPFPKCGARIKVSDITSGVGNVMTLFGSPYGGAVVAGGQLVDAARQRGGEISRIIERAEGGAVSSCTLVCAKTPDGSKMNYAIFKINDRVCKAPPYGGGEPESEWYPGETIEKLSCGGHQGWESIAVADNMACGTAANWKHDRNKTATIELY